MATRAFQFGPRTSASQSNIRKAAPGESHQFRSDAGEGQRLDGQASRTTAREVQSVQYLDDKEKFEEKEKEKANKKRADKWKRYSHVDTGRRIAESNVGTSHDLELIRRQQQLVYETNATVGLKLEQERQHARTKRDEQKREDNLKKYAQISVGQRLNDGEGRHLQNNNLGPRNNQIHRDPDDVNSRVSLTRAVKEKSEIHQTKKITSATSINNTWLAQQQTEMSCRLNGLNSTEGSGATARINTTAQVRDEEHHEQMRLARERMQKLYNEKKTNL